jgi:RHH-type proline utilization regulon transcriptional repressor/proline dehydrogenase/delta 1-pyrroline-5-carboxylate dehydrogenase
LRTPDAPTLDALIADKIGAGDWSRHLGKAASGLVNASTWALLLTGRTFRRIPAEANDLGALMHGLVQRLGEPLARSVVGEALRILARQFVLGRTIDEALDAAGTATATGYLHSFDMLGEAAASAADAQRYFLAYGDAITAIAKRAGAPDPHANAGISVKLSALHPRYEQSKHVRIMLELVPRVLATSVSTSTRRKRTASTFRWA